MKRLLFIGWVLLGTLTVKAQLFTKSTDLTDDLVAAAGAPTGAYSGCAWIDYDNDGWLDLYWVRSGLYHNTGTGHFELITNSHLRTDAGFGTTWADFDNDGYIDALITGGNTRGSSLHKNNGDGTFTKVITGVIGDSLSLRGWGAAFADFDNNKYVDIVIAAPFGFAGITDSNKLLSNNGDGSFTRIDSSIICRDFAPFTVPSWSDYDHDGDMDCFIGSGPADGTVAPDYLYKNQLMETGIANYFTKIDTDPIATDLLDGQIWNWIDYDNDGDLDAYLTNYQGTFGGIGMPNNLYRNDDGIFVKMTAADVGTIVSDNGYSLASVWADYDNDGDLDCYVTNDGPARCKYYENVNGFFTANGTEPLVALSAAYYGATAGDIDRDGDIDLFVSATSTGKSLYINSASTNGNSWAHFKLTGLGNDAVVGSNKSAIGAIVRVKATINLMPVWQMREVSAQNSFNSMNALEVAFGLGNAAQIDSLIIEWPSGIKDICTDLPANQLYEITENNCPEIVGIHQYNELDNNFLKISPNPNNGLFTISFNNAGGNAVTIVISDTAGKKVHETYLVLTSDKLQQKQLDLNFLPQGNYNCTLNFGYHIVTTQFTKY